MSLGMKIRCDECMGDLPWHLRADANQGTWNCPFNMDVYIYIWILYTYVHIYIYTYIHIHIWCLFASNIYVHQKLVLQYHDFHLFHHDFPVRFPPPEVPGWDGRGQCTGRQRAERLPGPGHSVDDSSALLGTYGRIPLVPWHGLGAWDS